jgi:hypothetical protein
MNETLFRDVNEQLKMGQGLEPGERSTFVCECALMNCQLRLTLSLEEYEEVRANAARFIVFPGHEIRDVEVVVGGDPERYRVVEKVGPGRKVAES